MSACARHGARCELADERLDEAEHLVRREPRAGTVGVARGATDGRAATPPLLALVERVEDGAGLRVRADGEPRHELRLLPHGVGDGAVTEHLVRDGLGVPVRVEQVEDEVVALGHHPAVADVCDLEAPLLLRAGRPLERPGDQLVDVLDAGHEELVEVGLAVLLGALQVGDRLHRALEEGIRQLRFHRRVGRAVRVHRADGLDEPPHELLRHPRGVLEKPDGEGRVAVHVIDVDGVARRVEAEQKRVHDLLTGGTRQETHAPVVMVEREPLVLHVNGGALHVAVERDALRHEVGELGNETAVDLDVHFLSPLFSCSWTVCP